MYVMLIYVIQTNFLLGSALADRPELRMQVTEAGFEKICFRKCKLGKLLLMKIAHRSTFYLFHGSTA